MTTPNPLDQIHSYVAGVQTRATGINPSGTGVSTAIIPVPTDPTLTSAPGGGGGSAPPTTSTTSTGCDWAAILTGTPGGSGSIGSGTAATSQQALSNCITGGSTLPTLLFAGFSWGRVAAFVMGLICLIAGLYMFKGTQTIVAPIVEGGKNLARGAVA